MLLQLSYFGYLVSGIFSDDTINNAAKYCFLSKNLETLNKTLTSFWKIENVENLKICNSEEPNYYDENFKKRYFRKMDGKYVVETPFKPEFSEIICLENKKKLLLEN